ncbi:DMP19 family protein [Pseudomonas sp. QD4]|uniref:DMP19 family protein n=1 Tax=Pseudomonas sp. QD4 TaxID=3368618 RepID=UPI003BA04DDC
MPHNPITRITFDDTMLCVGWADGLELRQHLTRFDRLREASAAQRADFQIIDEGTSVVWPRLATDGVTIDGIDWIWEHLCNQALGRLHALEWHLDQVSAKDQAIVALWRLEADGYNGGFLQFFCNWGDQTYDLAVAALQAIGAERTRELVSRQRQLIDHLDGHPQLKELWDIPGLLSDDEHELISVELDAKLWDVAMEIPALAVRHFYPG